MPTGQRSIIVGGGIAAAAPFTIGTLPMVTVTSPPTVSDSVYRQAGAGGRQILIGSGQTVSPAIALDAILIGRGAQLVNGWANMLAVGPSVVLGEENSIAIGATINVQSANGAGKSIAIGTGIDITTQGAGVASRNIVLGSDLGRGVGERLQDCILVGNTISMGGNGTGTAANIVIGHSAAMAGAGSASNNVAVGHGVAWRGNLSVSIGSGANAPTQSVVIGANANAGNTGTDNVAIGRASGGVNNRSRCVAVGSLVSFNGGDDNTAIGYNASTTGSGGIALGSGATAVATEFSVGAAAVPIALFSMNPGVAAPTRYRNLNAQPQVFRDSTNAFDNLSIAEAGGITVRAGITHGAATVLTTTVALINNAGAQAATILNGPVAGNPTKWIPINDNGIIRNFPVW